MNPDFSWHHHPPRRSRYRRMRIDSVLLVLIVTLVVAFGLLVWRGL